MRDNLLLRINSPPGQIPGAQMLCNDVPDELWCPLMWIRGGSVCAWCVSEVDDLFTAAAFWRAQEKRSSPRLPCAPPESETKISLWLQPARPLRGWDDEKHTTSSFIQILAADWGHEAQMFQDLSITSLVWHYGDQRSAPLPPLEEFKWRIADFILDSSYMRTGDPSSLCATSRSW